MPPEQSKIAHGSNPASKPVVNNEPHVPATWKTVPANTHNTTNQTVRLPNRIDKLPVAPHRCWVPPPTPSQSQLHSIGDAARADKRRKKIRSQRRRFHPYRLRGTAHGTAHTHHAQHPAPLTPPNNPTTADCQAQSAPAKHLPQQPAARAQPRWLTTPNGSVPATLAAPPSYDRNGMLKLSSSPDTVPQTDENTLKP